MSNKILHVTDLKYDLCQMRLPGLYHYVTKELLLGEKAFIPNMEQSKKKKVLLVFKHSYKYYKCEYLKFQMNKKFHIWKFSHIMIIANTSFMLYKLFLFVIGL